MTHKTVVVLAAGLMLAAAAAAPVSAAIKVTRINFDPAGRDTGTNTHLNKEWIILKNSGPRAKQLGGWKVHDRGRDHVYTFGRLYLQPGDTVKLRTGRGSDGASVCEVGSPCARETRYDFFWGLRSYVWNNRSDLAILRKRSGTMADRCRYRASVSSPTRC